MVGSEGVEGWEGEFVYPETVDVGFSEESGEDG